MTERVSRFLSALGQNKLTQKSWAEKTGIAPSMISEFKKGSLPRSEDFWRELVKLDPEIITAYCIDEIRRVGLNPDLFTIAYAGNIFKEADTTLAEDFAVIARYIERNPELRHAITGLAKAAREGLGEASAKPTPRAADKPRTPIKFPKTDSYEVREGSAAEDDPNDQNEVIHKKPMPVDIAAVAAWQKDFPKPKPTPLTHLQNYLLARHPKAALNQVLPRLIDAGYEFTPDGDQ